MTRSRQPKPVRAIKKEITFGVSRRTRISSGLAIVVGIIRGKRSDHYQCGGPVVSVSCSIATVKFPLLGAARWLLGLPAARSAGKTGPFWDRDRLQCLW